MPQKHPDAERIGGPGAAHENRQEPDKSKPRGAPPGRDKQPGLSRVSGGGGEPDRHHRHDPAGKAGD